MTTDLQKLAICAVASVLGHYAFARGLEHLPPSELPPPPPPVVQIRVVEPPPPPRMAEPEPEPPKPDPPKPIPPPPQVHERPRPTKVATQVQAEVPKDTPPVTNPDATATSTTPVFGVTMESTSQGGSGPAVQVGNTTRIAPAPVDHAGPAPKALADPVAAVEVTKMPMPQGRCSGKYTDEARAAAIEGTVVLDLVVDETGHAREVKVVEGLGGGLTDAAVAALTRCRFTPGEKDGRPVPVRVRGFKIRFFLQDGQ